MSAPEPDEAPSIHYVVPSPVIKTPLFLSFIVLGAIAFLLILWGFVVEPKSLHKKDYALSLPHWPSRCAGLKVAVLTDLHVGSPFNTLKKLKRVVALTQSVHPDLILLTGDYVIHEVIGGTFTPPEEIAKPLSLLSAPLGVWAVLGNHDWWLGGSRIQTAFKSAGIHFLEDAATKITSGNCIFWLVGISDFREGPHDVRRAMQSVPDAAPVVAFTHNPDVFPDIPSKVNLTIAGHTHGGQVSLPLIGRPIIPSHYGQRFAIGHIVEDKRHLFVSPGLGTSMIPVRFGVLPEVSVLTLHPATSQ